ncbi:MAG: Spy/CpxP family protein refolding chaperone [Candidatus Omnitrophica bacterium]|nr:Spy/CpxP family protein refolding chaperone [Candidatus Omnitrophota bacterium]
MLKREQLIILWLILGVLECSSYTFADWSPSRHNYPESREEEFEEIMKELNLTDEQERALIAERDFQRHQRQVLREKMVSLRQEIAQEIMKDKPDRRRLNVLTNRMKQLMGERLEHRIESILRIKQILTPEQFKRIQEKLQPLPPFKKGGQSEKTGYNHRFDYGRCVWFEEPEFCQRLG